MSVTPNFMSASPTTPLESVRFDATSNNPDLPTYPVRPSYREFHSQLHIDTQCVVFEGAPGDPHKPASVPIYQTATFVQPSATEFGAYDYTRSGNPTRTALERQVAMLEGAHAAFAFTSGMAALSAVTRLLQTGDELLVGDDIYGGMHRLVSRVTSALHGVRVRFVDTTRLDAVAAALTPATRMLHMESPSNPLMRITDVRALGKLLAARGVLLSIDSTMMSPILQRPLQLGADIVTHSATKFFGGHSDVMGGLVCLRDEALSKRVAFFQNAEGNGLDPFPCWLFLRGIKTMALRVGRSQGSAEQVARFLRRHPLVKELYYPGDSCGADGGAGGALARDAVPSEERAIHFSQASGSGCVLSFTTGSMAVSRRVIDALRVFKLTVSFGSVSSLCEMPCMLSHASIPAHLRACVLRARFCETKRNVAPPPPPPPPPHPTPHHPTPPPPPHACRQAARRPHPPLSGY
jgi:cystathionine beta-lyase